MELRYRNLPMDFADATLVVAAEALPCADIFTLDRRGFRVYRLSDRRFFRLLLLPITKLDCFVTILTYEGG